MNVYMSDRGFLFTLLLFCRALELMNYRDVMSMNNAVRYIYSHRSMITALRYAPAAIHDFAVRFGYEEIISTLFLVLLASRVTHIQDGISWDSIIISKKASAPKRAAEKT
jgi:hypothetical protein